VCLVCVSLPMFPAGEVTTDGPKRQLLRFGLGVGEDGRTVSEQQHSVLSLTRRGVLVLLFFAVHCCVLCSRASASRTQLVLINRGLGLVKTKSERCILLFMAWKGVKRHSTIEAGGCVWILIVILFI
jgi:hypothetical protein